MKPLTQTIGLFLLLLVGLASAEPTAQTSPPFKFSDQEAWMGIYYKGKKLGFSHHVLRVSSGAVEVKSRAYFRVKAAGADQVTSFAQETFLTPDLRLKNFFLLQEIMGHRQKVQGRLDEGVLTVHVTTLGYSKKKSIPFSPETAMSATFGLNLLRDGLQVGRKGTLPIFMEPLRIFSELEYEILRKESMTFEGKPVDTYVVQHRISGMDSHLWVTPEGLLLRELSTDGFESRIESRETARELGESMPISSFITLSLVKPQRRIDNPTRKRRIKVQLLNIRSPDLIPEDHRQKVLEVERQSDETYGAVVRVQTEDARVEAPAPFPLESFSRQELLTDSSEIQSNHPMIRELAKQLVDGHVNSWQAAQSISEWVYRNMDKKLVDTFTALDALRERRGECQSHTNLFVALARAAGIPAKVVNGLVYSKEYQGFVYHAWPEVFVGEWRALDPTFGQSLVDATHIKLGEGGKEGLLKLNEFVGKLKIRVLED